MVMPDMKKGLPYTFKTYKVAQSKSKCHLLTQSSLTSNKKRMNGWHLSIQGCGRAHLWAIHPSAIGGGRCIAISKSLCFHDLYSRCHSARMICFLGARICQPLPRLQSWREGRRGTICLQQTISSDVLNIIVIKHKISTKSCRYLLRNVIVCLLHSSSCSLRKGFKLSSYM